MKGWREYPTPGRRPSRKSSTTTSSTAATRSPPAGSVELCSHGPGFTLDQKLEDLGEGAVSLSPWTEPLRARLENDLTPIHNPRSRKKAGRRASAKEDSATALPSNSAAKPAVAALYEPRTCRKGASASSSRTANRWESDCDGPGDSDSDAGGLFSRAAPSSAERRDHLGREPLELLRFVDQRVKQN
jgi:hypothetical protein